MAHENASCSSAQTSDFSWVNIGQDTSFFTETAYVRNRVKRQSSTAGDIDILYIIAAPSGSGKTTLINQIQSFENPVPTSDLFCNINRYNNVECFHLDMYTHSFKNGRHISVLKRFVSKSKKVVFILIDPPKGFNSAVYDERIQNRLLILDRKKRKLRQAFHKRNRTRVQKLIKRIRKIYRKIKRQTHNRDSLLHDRDQNEKLLSDCYAIIQSIPNCAAYTFTHKCEGAFETHFGRKVSQYH